MSIRRRVLSVAVGKVHGSNREPWTCCCTWQRDRGVVVPVRELKQSVWGREFIVDEAVKRCVCQIPAVLR